MVVEQKKPLIILTGPTAAGKTKLSIGLAKSIGGEIISADSMQVYKKMDIGTAKIRPEEMDGVSHYLVDEFDPSEEFNVVVFVERAKDAMEKIYAAGHIPIIVGGTGFYIQALLYDIDFSEHEEKESYRKELEQLAKEKGREEEYALYAMVERMAPQVIGEKRKIYKGVNANVDFYSGLVYSMLDLPASLYTPIFAAARIVGWSAHRLEELKNVDKIIRPAYKPLSPYREYVKMEDR